MEPDSLVGAQRAYFPSGATRPLSARRQALLALRRAVALHQDDIARALFLDLGKSKSEAYLTETGLVLQELSFLLRRLPSLAAPKRVKTPPALFPATSRVMRVPFGVTLILSPWNYPVLLTLQPLASALAAGNNTITVSYSEGGVTRTDTQAITVTTISNTLNSNSWATIKAVSDAGQGDNYWDVGDTKAITINGNVGNTNFSNLSINVYIIGFNHNSAREGNNRIHFKIGKIGGTQVALCDAQYQTSQSNNGYFNMNPNNSNSGGWANSYHRRTLLGNTGTPTSPPSNSLLAALPADLRAVMKAVTKYSDNTGGGSNTASYVTSTTDYLFELAEFEYHGARTYANSAEQNYQQQYAYYQAGNSKIHYKHNATGTAAYVWCRSVYAGYTNNFCLVYTDGSANSYGADDSWGVAPGFAA